MSALETRTMLLVPTFNVWYTYGEARMPRSTSVILDEGVYERILHDIQNFVEDHAWYFDRGIPYRRGYLLYGPPGCGKTSLILALAGQMKYNLCVMSLNDFKSCDDLRLIRLMGEVPPKSLILLEDVDAMFVSRRDEAYEDDKKMTLSGLLNAVDGVVSCESRILFMTTNYIDRLDSALIRAGRVDFKQYIGTCSDYQLSQMFARFRPDSTDENRKRFVNEISKQNKPVVPAHLQEFFLVHRHKELDDIFEHINDLWQDQQDIQLTE